MVLLINVTTTNSNCDAFEFLLMPYFGVKSVYYVRTVSELVCDLLELYMNVVHRLELLLHLCGGLIEKQARLSKVWK